MAEKKPNILFDTLSALFNNKEYIANLTNESIRQNIFMINRRLAIQYPLQAQVFNNSKVKILSAKELNKSPNESCIFWF